MNDRVDVIERASNALKNFVTGLLGFVKHNWIKLVVLGVGATQTMTLFRWFAPSWAVAWLPILAVLLIEGGFAWWTWREQQADALENADGVFVKRQEMIANSMAWLTLVGSATTSIAGMLIEVSQSQLATVLHPNAMLTNFFGWVALAGVFVIGIVELWGDWAFKRADPTVAMEKEHRTQKRELVRKKRGMELKAENSVLLHLNTQLDKHYARFSKVIGRRRANAEFRERNADVFGVRRRRPIRARRTAKKVKK